MLPSPVRPDPGTPTRPVTSTSAEPEVEGVDTPTSPGAAEESDGFELSAHDTKYDFDFEAEEARRQRLEAATDAYLERVEEIVADGGIEGLGDVVDATRDLLLEVPIGAFAPDVRTTVREKLEEAGAREFEDFEDKRLADYGYAGRRVAEDLTQILDRDATPEALYGVAVVGAAAAGYLGGSEALDALGIEPKLETALFDDQVKASASASWDARFENPELVLDADGRFKVGDDVRLRADARVTVGGETLSELALEDARATFVATGDGFNATARARLSEEARVKDLFFRGAVYNDELRVDAEVDFGDAAELEEVAVDFELDVEPVALDVATSFDGEGGVDLDVDAGVDLDEVSVEAALAASEEGIERARVDVDVDVEPVDASGHFAIDGDGVVESAALAVAVDVEPVELSARVEFEEAAVFESAEFEARIDTKPADFGAAIAFDADGLDEASLDFAVKNEGLAVTGRATLDADGLDAANFRVAYDDDAFDVDAMLRFSDGEYHSAMGRVGYEAEPFRLSTSWRLDDDTRIAYARFGVEVADGPLEAEAAITMKDAQVDAILASFELDHEQLALSASFTKAIQTAAASSELDLVVALDGFDLTFAGEHAIDEDGEATTRLALGGDFRW